MTDSATYIRACAVSDLPERGVLGVEVNGTPLAIVHSKGEVYALHDLCSHNEMPLSDGDVYEDVIECAAHGSCFDLRTGAVRQWPAREPIAAYPAKVEGGDVYVSLDTVQPTARK